ncbi:hypothetical protein LJCM1130_19220 [Lactobacillus paragasseri]|uniref:HTH hxlR-type domain-containing protein n=1 Tax=Lactobacillus paragasseri TaxID=2107999 RepID=A0ABQ0N617_9LACO|nr:hypothetical protein LJCM1130_19220 [Lactobacillus paragasseri]
MQRHIFNCSNGCPVESTLQIISGKWKSVILYHLIKNKVCRFSELQKKCRIALAGCYRYNLMN